MTRMSTNRFDKICGGTSLIMVISREEYFSDNYVIAQSGLSKYHYSAGGNVSDFAN